MTLDKLRTGPRQALGFGLVIALMALVVGISVQRLHVLGQETDHVLDLQHRAALADQWRSMTEMNAVRALAIAKSGGAPAVIAAFDAPMKATSQKINDVQRSLTALITSDQGRALAAAIAGRRSDYLAARQQVMDQLKAGNADAAADTLAQKMAPMSDAYVAAINELTGYQEHLVLEASQGIKHAAESAIVLALALLGAAALVAAVFGRLVTLSITRPLRTSVQAAEAMAAGDMTHPIATEGRDEMAQMLRALAAMQEALRRVIGQVRTGSDSMSTASAQIAGGNQDLSSRTEQTASNLQQAASSLEQLTGTVRQTAESARTATQLAASAASVARRGGSVVSEVVSTMDEISTSSRKIADIIGTIDGIAFQTNILALNAAVEAARAGEQGRGFAVVASEVRSLAQRSAEAAREIKSLIGASVDKVESGARLVGDAGSTMTEIVASVQRVADIIGEIGAATGEQSSGIAQVNEAVAQLDRMTQQNAALVEESAAAAGSMQQQAAGLAGLVAMFRLGSQAASTPALQAPPAPSKPSKPSKAPAPQMPAAAAATRPAATPSTGTKAAAAQAAAPGRVPAPVPAPAPAVPAAADADWETF